MVRFHPDEMAQVEKLEKEKEKKTGNFIKNFVISKKSLKFFWRACFLISADVTMKGHLFVYGTAQENNRGLSEFRKKNCL